MGKGVEERKRDIGKGNEETEHETGERAFLIRSKGRKGERMWTKGKGREKGR
jgi:hypothetical protein